MTELPPGFVLEQPVEAASPQLPPPPPGFVVEGSPDHQQADPAGHKSFMEKLGETSWGKLAKGAYDAVTLPGDVYSGKVAPGSEEELNRARAAAWWLSPASAALRGGEGVMGAALTQKEALPSGVQAAKTAEELGAPLPVGIASDSKVSQAATKAAQQLPIVGPKIGERVAATVDAAGKKVGDIADELGGGITDRATAGATLRPSLKGVVETNNTKIGDAYNGLRAKIDQSEPVALEKTAKVVDDIVKARKAAGQLKPEAGLEDIKNLADNGATFDGLQRARTDIGNSLNFGTANPGFNAGDLKRIYGAMSEDMKGVVAQSVKPGVKSEEAVRALQDAHAEAAPLMEFNKTLNKLDNIKVDESLVGTLVRSAQDKTGNVKLLAQLRGSMPKEDFQQIGAVALSELGHNAAAGRFSLNQFATKWEGLGDRAKGILFSPEHRTSLDAIAQLGRHIKDADKFANTSNTSGASSWAKVIAGAAAAGGALLYGDPTKLLAALGTAGGGFLLARALAQPATASSIAKWARAAVAAQNGQTPARMAALKMSARNLLNNLNDQKPSTGLKPIAVNPQRASGKQERANHP